MSTSRRMFKRTIICRYYRSPPNLKTLFCIILQNINRMLCIKNINHFTPYCSVYFLHSFKNHLISFALTYIKKIRINVSSIILRLSIIKPKLQVICTFPNILKLCEPLLIIYKLWKYISVKLIF